MRIKTSDGKEIALHVDLIVDCTESYQSGLQWLKDLELKHGEDFGLEKKSYSRNVARHDRAEKLACVHEWWTTEPDMYIIITFGFWRMDHKKSVSAMALMELRSSLKLSATSEK
ncbi:hypothetical protein M422DRAFT_267083 [Sphaerobolus stellatus SS14]|uniref:Unplaced genomic scaffold SPHSTscaffold_170, whole genome shotgun sequence n=1 Tax=Sphaerobolus stellatus (strain SS14) TaxID=990650 RepID=A0A0C9TMS4_SPHS4|nr:hypothetical protein M422DRAFT_267083 [Sphaerobolus stellatus SS14]